MFAVIRYIILFIMIMLGLFFLQKNSSWFQEKIEYTKIFFKTLGEENVSTDFIYNDLKKQDFTDIKIATSTVKSYSKNNNVDNIDKPSKNEAKISIDGIIYYTNEERKKKGLQPLVKNTQLGKSASLKTDDMFAGQYFEHISPKGESAADLVKSVNYKFQIVGENLALGIFDTDKALVQAWMNSPAHRDNILNPKYTEMGAAVGISEYKGQKQWMAVQHFAKPLPLCPEVDTVVQEKIDSEKKILESEERELQMMAGVIESNPRNDALYLNQYNAKVAQYNDRLNKLRDIINDFNKTIVEYNNCLKGI